MKNTSVNYFLFARRRGVERSSCVFLFIVMSFSFSHAVKAQVLQMTDFTVFGGAPDCPSGPGQTPPSGAGCGVTTGNGTALGGNIGSYQLVKTGGAVDITGNVYSGGKVNFANGVDVTGRIAISNLDGITTNILTTGSGATIGGNIDANGNIFINVNGSTIGGTLTQPSGATYSGPVPAGGNITAAPSLPTLPAMPAITSFPAAGATDITSTQTISPGAYNNLVLGNPGGTITFAGPGDYVFNTIQTGQGPTKTFVYNLMGTTSGLIRVYVHGDVNLGDIIAQFINGPADASRIYFETHGTGSGNPLPYTRSFIIGSGSTFYGTVWAPYAAINIGSGSGSANVAGHFWSATQVSIGIADLSLPVELLSFDLSDVSGDVQSNWVTASEINNDYFILQKSTDGEDFFDIAKIEGADNSTVPQHYSSLDKFPVNGYNYYRLCQVDNDGTINYLPTKAIKINGEKEEIQLLPNPASGPDVYLVYSGKSASTYSIAVYDIRGKMILNEKNLVLNPGFNALKNNFSALSKGAYLVSVIFDNDKAYHQKLVITY